MCQVVCCRHPLCRPCMLDKLSLKFSEVSLHMYKEMIYFINTTIIKIKINVRASMSLYTRDHGPTLSHKLLLQLPVQLSTSIHHSHSYCRSPTFPLLSLLFPRPPQRAGFLYRSPGRAGARQHALQQLTSKRAAARASCADDVINYTAARAGVFSPARHVTLT